MLIDPAKRRGLFLVSLLFFLRLVGRRRFAEHSADRGGGGGDKTSLSFLDTKLGESKWVVIGDMFQQFRIVSYDGSAECAILERDGKSHRVPLKMGLGKAGAKAGHPMQVQSHSRTKHGHQAVGPIDAAKFKAIGNMLRQFLAAADYHFDTKKATGVTYAEMVGPEGYHYIKQRSQWTGRIHRAEI